MLEGVKFKKCVYVDHHRARLIPTCNFGPMPSEKDGLDYYCRPCRANCSFAYRRRKAKREGRVMHDKHTRKYQL